MQGNTKKDATFQNLAAQRATVAACSVGELVVNLPGATGPNLLFYGQGGNGFVTVSYSVA